MRMISTLHLYTSSEADLGRAAELLRAGKLVAFPTETVYGLGARADCPEACERLFSVKRRPPGKKAAVLVRSIKAAEKHVPSISPEARRLADAFWPGPLTLVLPDGCGDCTGLRCPDFAPALRLLEMAGVPVLAPSANMSGMPPALNAEEVFRYFDGVISAVLDGGTCGHGRASTVVRVEGGRVEILREGPVSRKSIEKCVR